MKSSVKPRKRSPPTRAMRTRSGRKTTALTTRRTKLGSRGRTAAPGGSGFTPARDSARSAEATASALEVIDRLVEVFAPEIGPENVGHPELRVRELPEQEIGDAKLAAGADQEIGIGKPVRVQHAREELLVDPLRLDPVRARLDQDAADRVHDLRAPAVGERQHQDHAVVPL